MADHEDEERKREARRAIARATSEGGLTSTPELSRKAQSIGDHFAARDADQSDAAEVWGTRIARGLAAVFFVVLVVYLARLLLS